MDRDAIRKLSAALAAAPDAAALRSELVERIRDAIGGSAAALEAAADTPGTLEPVHEPVLDPSGRTVRVPIAGLGVIRVEFAPPRADSAAVLRELPALQAIAELGVQLQFGRERADRRQRLERRVGGAFTHVSTLEGFSSALESLATELFDAEYSALYFLDPESGRIRLMASTGLSAAERAEAERTAHGRHPGRVIRTGEIIEVADTDADVDRRTETEPGRRVPIRSRIYLPVRSSGKVVGALGMASPRPNAFGDLHRDTLEFLSNLSGLAYGRLQAEAANTRRSRFTEAAAIAGERLLAASDWRQSMHAALGMLGSALDAATIAAVQVVPTDDPSAAHEEYAWQPYFGEPWMRGAELARPSAEARAQLARGDAWQVDLASESGSLIAKPILVDGSLWGVLAIEHAAARPGPPDRDERLALRAFSNSVAVAIARERLDATLRTRQRMEAVGTLAAGIAHDFNNLLWPIILYSEMLERNVPGDPRAVAMLRDMQQAARRASELVQQVLAISRHRDRSLELVGLPDIVAHVAHLLRRAAPPGIAVQAEIDADAGRVLGDPAELEQVVVALGTRAITGQGLARSQMHVILDRVDRFGGRWMRICVRDDGPELDAAARARFFDAPDGAADPNGDAARLSRARRIVAEHAGRIEVRRGDDGLNLVEVLLPIDAIDFSGMKAADFAAAPAPPPIATDDARPGERILLVDDDPAVLEVARTMLETIGYEVVACSGGAIALDRLRDGAERFDLILTDLTMPGMTGIDLTRAAKAIRPSIPVVCCTGYGDERVERRAYEAGMSAFVRKPIEFELLSATIRRAIDGVPRG